MDVKVRPAKALVVVAGVASALALVVAVAPASASLTSPAAGNPQPHAVAPGTITTIAGGLGGPGLSRAIGEDPCGMTYARHELYVTDLMPAPAFAGTPAVVRQISTASGALVTIAGTGTTAHGDKPLPAVPDGSSARSAAIEDSCGVAIDHSGNVLVSDSTDYADGDQDVQPYGIRVIAESTGKFYGRHLVKGDEYTLVKSSAAGLRDDGPGTIAVDAVGNVLFTGDNDEIWARATQTGTFYGVKMKAGGLFLIAGGGDTLKNGVPATRASLAFVDFENFNGIASGPLRIDHQGNLVVADEFDSLVRVIAAKNGTFYGQVMKAGRIYTIAGDHGVSPFRSPDGGLATRTGLLEPGGIAIDRRGNVLIEDGPWVVALAQTSGKFYDRNMVRGHLYRIIGSEGRSGSNGGPARSAGPIDGGALSVDGFGNVVIASHQGVRVVPTGTGTVYGERMRALHIYSIAPAAGPLDSGDSAPATQAELQVSTGRSDPPMTGLLAQDRAGDLFIVDGAAEVRMIAGATGTRFGLAVQAGHIYRIAGNGSFEPLGSGGSAREAGLNPIFGLSTDAAGNLLLASGEFERVLVVPAFTGNFYGQHMTVGHLYPVAGNGGEGETGDGGPASDAQIGSPTGVATDAAGDILIAALCQLRVVAAVTGTHYGQAMTAGDIYTIAGTTGTCADAADGSPASSASLSHVGEVVVDSDGNVLISDESGIRVIAAATGTFYRQSMTAGDLYTVQTPFISGGFTVDGAGNLVVADQLHNSISVLAQTSGTFYGVRMTAGQTYQVAGNGFLGHSGDGGQARQASLVQPVSVVVTPHGDLIEAEFHWIRKITGG